MSLNVDVLNEVVYVITDQDGVVFATTLPNFIGQSAIQFEDEGVALGTAGTVSELDFVGAGVSAVRVGNKVTVSITATGGGGTWGSITGTLSAQTDLQTALNALQPLNADLTIISSLGSALQMLRVNAGATAIEYYTPLTNPATTLGDIIQFDGSAFTRLAATAAGSFLRTAGTSTAVAYSTVKLPNTISALSIWLANSANTMTEVTPAAGQSIRLNAGGTAWEAFTPSTGAWALTGTSTLTGVATITSNTSLQHVYTGTWTAGANNDYHELHSGTITSRNTASDSMIYSSWTPTLVVNVGAPASQTLTALSLKPVFTGTATKVALEVGGLDGNLAITYSTNAGIKLRASTTTANTILATTGAGSRIFLMSDTEFQVGGLGSDTPSTAFSTGMNVSSNYLNTANKGWVQTVFGTRTDTSGNITGHYETMSVSPSSGGGNFVLHRIRGAGAASGSATQTNTLLEVQFATNEMNIGTAFRDIHLGSAVTQNAASSVPWTAIYVDPTINQTSSGAGTKRILWYKPTETALLGSHYFIVSESTTALSGFATAAPANAYVVIGAGTTTIAPLKLTTGTNLTSAVAGCFEYNNTFHLTNSDATRRHVVLCTTATKTTAGAPYTNDGYITVSIGGTDVKVMTTA